MREVDTSEIEKVKKVSERLLGKERVQILLHEYNGLRNEIIHRTNNMFQVIAVGAVILGWVANSHCIDSKLVALLFAGAGILGGLLWLIYRDIDKAATRLAEI